MYDFDLQVFINLVRFFKFLFQLNAKMQHFQQTLALPRKRREREIKKKVETKVSLLSLNYLKSEDSETWKERDRETLIDFRNHELANGLVQHFPNFPASILSCSIVAQYFR